MVAGKARRDAATRPLMRFLVHGCLSAVLISMSIWTIRANWPLRSVHLKTLEPSERAAHRLADIPEAQYAFGMQFWNDPQPEKAARFFRQAVSGNVLHIDAWLRLAEAEAVMGNISRAKAILAFTDRLTDGVQRWKWPQMVLASQLGMIDHVRQYANDLLTHRQLTQDTFQLLYSSLRGDAEAVLSALDTENLPIYLEWLMRWGLAGESLAVWRAMTITAPPDNDLSLRYADFLLSHKRIDRAAAIWRQVTGSDGLTNPGFEKKIINKGFGWRLWPDKQDNWDAKRIFSESAQGRHSLRLRFGGKANIAFHHLFQIISVNPGACYTLSYTWKTIGITTDQGPFMEVVGYDRKGLHVAGKPITGTHNWQEAVIDFTVPTDCKAIIVRLRRTPSMRFDSKIRGTLWLDNFRLEDVGTDPAQCLREASAPGSGPDLAPQSITD